MFDDLRDLYQEVILDHGRRPRNFRRLENATHTARGDNPLCGDRMELFLAVEEGGRIADAAFEGRGCAISMASASLMTEVLRGLTAEQARRMSDAFRTMAMTGSCPACEGDIADGMERLSPLAGVHEYPSRVKCATLAWHTLNAALENSGREASSE
ncbi:MAG: SUF system NifU family Fe-S cluster assembly protein [Rhodovarius sp.]|nr:SUF system NifU family Fe-S cluster assembly protein [Rhodovarius sp.]MDW8313965.1 SUF system NifU family Fe-S cluster assembly protein [Rhodovarius sp.]